MNQKFKSFLHEIILRILLLGAIKYLSYQPTPDYNTIQPEEWYRYKRTEKEPIVDEKYFIAGGCLISTAVLIISYSLHKDKREMVHSILAISMGICLTALVTHLMKVFVAKPRPSFFMCCYPDGQMQSECTGDPKLVDAGRKSFPSGHTSFAFSIMVFLFLYLSAKLNLFNDQGKGESWRTCICLSPIILAVMIGVCRTTKNQHHPEDVLAGGIIGSVISYICYRQHFPSVYDPNPGKPYEFADDPFAS